MTAVAVAALLAAGCFKSVVTYTRYTAAIYNQTTESGPYARAQQIDSYAYYVDTTEWRVASYEDAVDRIITNKSTGEQRSVPDVLGAFNSSKEYSMSMILQQELSMIVVVNPELKLYAYRSYELPVNLESVATKLYMCSWRRTYASSGWIVVNDFYVEETPEANPDDGAGAEDGSGDDGTGDGSGNDGAGDDTGDSDGGTDDSTGGNTDDGADGAADGGSTDGGGQPSAER